MKVEKKLNISAENFYDKMMNSVIFDIRKATGKTITRKQLKNFSYVKQFTKNSSAKIAIEELVENRIYQFKTSTSRNEFVVRYEIEPIDENKCYVSYNENMKSFGFMQQMNDMLLGIMLGFFRKRQFGKMLENMASAN
ncbi:hypothetical protein EsVE80_09420 [Enterococcus saigonensis]|uniref:DUF3284 domain-containing protein n=1 Tax=Enterococcus saigonensis TaxID=1805431 RepID=A0A679IBF2_9ENTE|nr:DUF3284 domain-containing protein [Enterococcus saigonensis]BCA85419.1 hypothetical protein EsVE80_09420 [Enterococcus saigonensis]